MFARRARLLSWLVDVASLAFCVSMIWIFVAYVYLDLPYYRSEILELPLAEKLSLWSSLLFFKPLPESLRGPCQYLPNQEWIRLVKIHNASDGGVTFTLEKFLLRDVPPYRALSYTWGPAEGVPEDRDTVWLPLLVNGRTRNLPKNLVRALIQFRDLKFDGYFWIDALCIDQLDIKKRSAQVSIMDKIYQRAEVVDVWLGRSYPDTDKVNDILRELLRLHEQYHGTRKFSNGPIWTDGSHILPEVDWETLVQILSRRLFHRVWTLQEFALGTKVNVWCGPHIIDLRLLQKSA
ncbi:hypothetical protein EPUS_06467 [Endocarpon pusillum Z07020]|uniref:Heterokaryon incompatibility domain-containing protein n=1 Tax=Endocarpon pusillum (strain Z07020 / HMAS-L-300199) TaxID=1263415 RepID=U1GHN6_ENDPU|nr:uncharacterized protein EPUS_06467 [Endocarpon pusillum Z07020]ERF77187.1 hypothetical protein EPUS_06467 [Endocarpon pusillum Z07020]